MTSLDAPVLLVKKLARIGVTGAQLDWTALISVVVISWFTATILTSSQLFHTGILNIGDFGLARHLDGSVHRPFAYRVFTDWLVRKVLAMNLQSLPLPFPRLSPVVDLACKNQVGTPPATCDQIRAYALVASIFIWGFLVATYVAALHVVGGRLWSCLATCLGALAVNSILLQQYGQPYDFVVLFFSTILFLLTSRQRDIWFTCFFVVACFVKESLFLFALVYACVGFRRRSLRNVLCRFATHSAIFTIIYAGERSAFKNNAGAPMYHNVSGHLQYFVNTLDISHLLLLVFTCLLVLYQVRHKALVIRRGMFILPILFGLYVAGGNPGEFRIVFELFPFILLPVVDTLKRLIVGFDERTVAEPFV